LVHQYRTESTNGGFHVDLRTESTPSGAERDPFLSVLRVLLALALAAAAAAIAGGIALSNPLLLDLGVTLGISSGILTDVVTAPRSHRKTPESGAPASEPLPTGEAGTPAGAHIPSAGDRPTGGFIKTYVQARLSPWVQRFRGASVARRVTAIAGVLFVWLLALAAFPAAFPSASVAAIAAALCLAGAGLAATGAFYFAGIEPAQLPAASGLARLGRVVAWILVVAALSMGLTWAGLQAPLRILHFLVLAIDAAVCFSLVSTKPHLDSGVDVPSLDLPVLSLLGSRTNVVASVLDTVERQLGIDLRSTWALTVVRRTAEPLVIGLCLLGWLSTSLTIVGVQEQGLVERLGAPVGSPPLLPGIHLHWPWPVDRVFRLPVQRVDAVSVGHEGEENGGPEDVLWARQHAANEYTLLLGNGRDLIAVDATVQYRIRDAPAWHYHCQNPAEALRAIAYRAVMRSTVNRTLADALSENVTTLTAQMRDMVQHDADALGLGAEVVAFTLGGMHPPVAVASDYQAVASAELGKVTAVVTAQGFRNEAVPAAEAAVVTAGNAARAEGAEALARAAGEAWSFRALESSFLVAPEEYRFRRRLEALEKGLAGRRFTVVDHRIQRDGGELWLTP